MEVVEEVEEVEEERERKREAAWSPLLDESEEEPLARRRFHQARNGKGRALPETKPLVVRRYGRLWPSQHDGSSLRTVRNKQCWRTA